MFLLGFRTINSGKSKRNEDQARIQSGVLRIPLNDTYHVENRGHGQARSGGAANLEYIEIPYRYFGLFDGHAGPGAAVAAAQKLHLVIHVSRR